MFKVIRTAVHGYLLRGQPSHYVNTNPLRHMHGYKLYNIIQSINRGHLFVICGPIICFAVVVVLSERTVIAITNINNTW